MSLANDFNLPLYASKVFTLLKNKPETRDCDRQLIYWAWKDELGEGDDVLQSLIAGSLSHPETLSRVRRKLQEKYEDLRGEKWASRHRMEGAICQQLTFFDLMGLR